jgi:hypothetical protein
MNKFLMIVLLFCLAHRSFAQPGTEIYLFDLKIKPDKITIDHGRNITNHKGYDNQPFFHPDKQIIYYTSADSSGRTDIVEYNYKSKNTKKFTQTHDKEYSPTVTPDKQFISCIIQRDSGQQDLGKYPVAGGEPKVLIDNLIVGYHVWANQHTVGVFTLPAPFKLHLVNLTTQKDTVVAENIGRSLHKIPGANAISFVQKMSEEEWVVNKIDVETFKITVLAKNLPGKDYHMAWTSDGRIVMSDGNKLFFYVPGKRLEWKPVHMEESLPLNNLSRIAVSQDGKFLALVVSE